MLNTLRSFSSDESANISIEYALIAVIVSISIVAGCNAIAAQLAAIFDSVSSVFSTALPAK